MPALKLNCSSTAPRFAKCGPTKSYLNRERAVSGVVLIVLALGLAGCTPKGPVQAQGEGPLKTEQEFRDKLAELRMQREKSARAVARLEERKVETVAFLKEKGVKSAADVAQDTNLKYAARELKGWSEEIEKRKQDLVSYDEAIKAIETMLKELERKRISEMAAMSEEDYIRLRKIVLDLNDRLEVDKQDVIADEELDLLLKEELGKGAEAEPSPVGGSGN